MATVQYFDVEIKDQGKTRTVRVALTFPSDESFVRLQELAQRAWDSPNKKARMGSVVAQIGRTPKR